jgi:hypothetical protein
MVLRQKIGEGLVGKSLQILAAVTRQELERLQGRRVEADQLSIGRHGNILQASRTTLSLEARENAFKDVDGLGLVALLQVEVELESFLLLADHPSSLTPAAKL